MTETLGRKLDCKIGIQVKKEKKECVLGIINKIWNMKRSSTKREPLKLKKAQMKHGRRVHCDKAYEYQSFELIADSLRMRQTDLKTSNYNNQFRKK